MATQAAEMVQVPQSIIDMVVWLVQVVAWIVGAAATICVSLLGALFAFYWQDRKQVAVDREKNNTAHEALGQQIISAKNEVNTAVTGVKRDVEDLSTKVDNQGKALNAVQKAVGSVKQHLVKTGKGLVKAGESGS